MNHLQNSKMIIMSKKIMRISGDMGYSLNPRG